MPLKKIYPDEKALKEHERMQEISVKSNSTPWDEIEKHKILKLSILNARSVKNKFVCIKTDQSLMKSDIIILCETWLEKDDTCSSILLENFNLGLCGVVEDRGWQPFIPLTSRLITSILQYVENNK